MPNSVDFSGKPFHFIGIGGIGMSALAYVLAKRKLPVSGSDIRLNHITQRLKEIGAHIFWSQDAANLEFFQPSEDEGIVSSSMGVSAGYGKTTESLRYLGRERGARKSDSLPQVVCSTAINPANSEYQAALRLGCPIFHRSDILAALIQNYQSIAVAGTHGKTTTSSLIGYLLLETGLDPTIVVGGEVDAWGGNATVGAGECLVAEADESDGSLAKLSAYIGTITNIELDHPDHYDSLEDVVKTFQVFAERCEHLVGCIDCPTVRDRIKPAISYSLDPKSGACYTADRIVYGADGTTAQIWERGVVLGDLSVPLLGKHNLSNALAAVAVGRLLGLEFSAIAQAIATFEGAHRRFEIRGEHQGILFVDDYAHHPSEISATLAAARLQVQGQTSEQQRVVAIFQPHRYSRTLAFLSEFAQCFGDADIVIISDIYSAGEPDLKQINGQQLAEIVAQHHPCVYYEPLLESVRQLLIDKILCPGDLALFLGAGNLNQSIPEVMLAFQQQKFERTLSQESCSFL